MPALAQFSGYYAPENWLTTHLPNAPTDQGSMDFDLAPVSITLIGSDTEPATATFSALVFSIVAPASGTFSFNWAYTTNDSGGPGGPPLLWPFYDPASYVVNTQTQLTVDEGLQFQSGSISVLVSQGDVIGFRIDSVDNFAGNATLTITNFMAPIPEPASVALMSLGLLGVAVVAARRRRSN